MAIDNDDIMLFKEHLVSLAGLISKYDKKQKYDVFVKPLEQYGQRYYYLLIEQDLNNYRAQYLATGWNADRNIPVLLFNLYDTENNIVSDLATIEKVILKKIDDVSSVISQEESPVTGLPAWSVHPCLTRQFLQDLKKMASNTVIGGADDCQVVSESTYCLYVWLQTFGKFVSLDLPYVTLSCK